MNKQGDNGLVWVKTASGQWTQVPAAQAAAKRAAAPTSAAAAPVAATPRGPGLLKAPVAPAHAERLMRDATYGALWTLVLAA
jgi:hypothetical protein